MELKGKLVVITGASRGIGAATAVALGRQGCTLALLARTASDLEEVAHEVSKVGGKAICFPCDLRHHQEIDRVCDSILGQLGTPDILIHNAGVGRWLFTEETPAQEAEDMFALPFKAAFHLSRKMLPTMLSRHTGTILVVNSPASMMVWPGSAGYASSRWALRGFVEALRMDLAGTGLIVSEVIFGKVKSSYFVANPGAEERLPGIARMIPELTTAQCGDIIAKVLQRGKRRKLAPWILRILDLTLWIAPGLVRAWVRMTGYRRAAD